MVETTSSDDLQLQLQNQILKYLHEHTAIDDTSFYAKSIGIVHTDLDKSLKSLLVDDYLILTVIERKLIELTDEGASYASKGTPEY